MRRALLFLTLIALLAGVPAAAAARSIVIERFDVQINVAEEGPILVTETMQFRFTGSWNGIIRLVPIEYRYKGFNYTLFLDAISVTDDRGNELRHEISREGHLRSFKIWVPGASDAVRTVVLRYRARNALRYFDEHDELYWNVTGDEWEMPIEAANATISLPPNVTGLRTLAYTGAYGSAEQSATVDISGNLVRVLAQRPLGVREGLTVVVGWDKGFVRQPGFLSMAGDLLRSNWPLFFPIGVLAVMFLLWHARGRDPALRPIAPQYEPPAGMTPAEVGTLIDNTPDMRDITATLVDLAVRGYLYIDETETQQLLGLWTGREYAFELRKPREDWGGLNEHERRLLSGLFTGGMRASGTRVSLTELENQFYKELPGIRDAIYEKLLQRGYYDHRPDKVKKAYMIFAGAMAILAFSAAGPLEFAFGQSPLTTMIAGFLSAGVIAGFGWFMPARTLKGAQALEGVLGFEDFLERVESDRFERMVKTPQMFEKFLPFAMAFGVEKNWVRAFDDIYKQAPDWYRGGHFDTGFRPTYFVNNLSSMSSRAGTTMASSPRSTGGSGFGGGGGGFSGGGFGGGGGRGF
ncbi:MAG: DUF2207 domain-containing protein [Acidobacteria bacterium]|nr:DUF2207 domain-containing protein [Acidobacteriota bacterium]